MIKKISPDVQAEVVIKLTHLIQQAVEPIDYQINSHPYDELNKLKKNQQEINDAVELVMKEYKPKIDQLVTEINNSVVEILKKKKLIEY